MSSSVWTCRVSKPRKAFTLSELLIAVAILGFIAILTLPNIIRTVETQQKKAVFKETIANLQITLIEGMNSGKAGDDLFTFQTQKMNATKVCPNNGETQGCISGTPHWEFTEGAYVLPNGAVIGGFGYGRSVSTDDSFVIDWNGSRPPNTLGEDVLWLAWVSQTLRVVPIDQVNPFIAGGSTATPMYNSIFSDS
jgi:prepilin-type N-terminal cleavage/methylation domain-containing protein